jgi:hypothetical protein
MVGLMSGAVVVTTACGGGEPPPSGEQTTQTAPAPGGEVDERPPAKMPRPPFLALSESDSIAEKILSKGKDRALATAPQRGPFGDGESTTVIYTEPVEGLETPGVGGVVVRGSTAIELPFENDAALVPDKPIDVVWASGEHGWQLVVLLQRERVDGAAQENQAFYWDGTTYARDTMAEERVRTMTSPSTIRQTLL